MQIHVYQDDLSLKYNGKPENVTIADFPNLSNKLVTHVADCIVFHWGTSIKILKEPKEV